MAQLALNFQKKKTGKKKPAKMSVGETKQIRIPAQTRTIKKVGPNTVRIQKGRKKRKK